LNIAGLDLIMSFNNRYKSGFTGTPSIPNYIDISDENTMQVLPEQKKTLDLINKAYEQSEFKTVEDQESNNIYLKKILESTNNKCNVMIDIGGVLVGLSIMDIYNIVKEHKKYINRFIYWESDDKNHEPKSIINGNIEDFNGIYDEKNYDTFYYYDNQHITGIDAKIPLGTMGLALIGKDSRERDVAQGIFRMRKLAINDDPTKRHTITFIITNKIEEKIKKNLKKPNIVKNDLFDWFKL
jgi:hypothetical protein